MFTVRTITPEQAATAPANAIRPLGELSDLVCGDRLGRIVDAIQQQAPSERFESYQIIATNITEKLGKLDPEALGALSERERNIAALDIKLAVHAMRQIGEATQCGLSNLLQDRAAELLHGALGMPQPEDGLTDSLELSLGEVLRHSPSRDPRGYTAQMRADIRSACGRSVVFVIDDMRGGFAYPGLQGFVDMAELTQRGPVNAEPRRLGW